MKKMLSVMLAVIFALSCFVCTVSAESGNFEFDENGKFTVLHISDPQDDRYPAHELNDFIVKAIEASDPDFIVISGDIVEDSRAGDISDDEIFKEGVLVEGDYEKTLENVKIAVDSVFAPIEEAGIYYAVTMGNNDYKAEISNEDWLAIFASYPHCITVDESTDAEGKIDQYVEIMKNGTDEAGFGLWLLDNGRGFTEGQKEWFKAKETGNVPSIVFEHIPTDDIGNLYEKCNIWDKGALLGDDGLYRLNPEIASGINYTVSQPGTTTEEFLMWKDKGVTGAFFGHIHTDGFTGTIDGITLGLTYGFQFSKSGPYGMRTLELDENGTFETDLYLYEKGEFTLQKDDAVEEESFIDKLINVFMFLCRQLSAWLKF
ncbi:MAG: hypothetical protein E7555_06975 [Ruminococcaceae bacterium]|nr:hypothetical protein [Oscillospiraceae bacterium]